MTSRGSLFDWTAVTHRGVTPELFRCPSPRSAPFRRLSTAGNPCHLPAAAAALPSQSQLLEWTGFTPPLALSLITGGKGEWKMDTVLIISWASVQPRDENDGEFYLCLLQINRNTTCRSAMIKSVMRAESRIKVSQSYILVRRRCCPRVSGSRRSVLRCIA